MYPLPHGSTRLGPARHPVDNQPGTALRFKSGVEGLWLAGVLRTLPKNWRDYQTGKPDPESRVLDSIHT